MAVRIFDSPVDCMNKSCIKIYVDSSYNKEIADYYKENNVSPIYDIVGEECVSFVPMVELVSMVVTGITFRFADDSDIVICVNIIKKYLEHLGSLGVTSKTKSLSDDDRIVVENCENAIVMLDPHKRCYDINNKIENTAPKTLTELIPKNWR